MQQEQEVILARWNRRTLALCLLRTCSSDAACVKSNAFDKGEQGEKKKARAL